MRKPKKLVELQEKEARTRRQKNPEGEAKNIFQISGSRSRVNKSVCICFVGQPVPANYRELVSAHKTAVK